MPHSTVDDFVSASTRETIGILVNTMVIAEHGGDAEASVSYLHAAARSRLLSDLFDTGREFDEESHDYAERVLRHLVGNGLVAQQCQCKSVFPQGCPHGTPVDSRWCGEHFELDAKELYGARFCNTCYAHLVVTRWA